MLCFARKVKASLAVAAFALATSLFSAGPSGSLDVASPSASPPSVDSKAGWQKVPSSIAQGEKFQVTYVSGAWTVDYRNYPRVGPQGYSYRTDKRIYQPCKADASQPYGKLLGRIGERGQVFPVGSGGTFTARQQGTLFLRINDRDACLGDNAGSVDVVVAESDTDVVHPLSVQDFDAYCKDQGFGQGVTTIGEDAYSIRCKNDDGSLQEFANDEEIHNFVEGVCGATYPNRNAIDRLRTMADTYSAWECMDSVSYAGVPDLEGWCEAKGLNLLASDNAKYAAYRWFCVNSDRSRVEGIPMDQVCKWQYGPDALDRLANANATEVGDAWDCRYVR